MTRDDQEPDELDAATRAALARWQPARPPAGFVDRVVVAAGADAATRPPRRRPRWPLYVAGLASAAVLVALVWPVRSPAPVAVATRAFAARETLALGGRGVAVIEPGTALGWRRTGTALAVQQDSGDVFYRVDRGAAAPFVVTTPAGEIRVTGTCFRVEVTAMKPSRASLLGAAAGAIVATAAVVTVYEGKVLVASPSGSAEVKAGEQVSLGGPGAPTPTPTAGAAAAVAIALPAAPSATITRDELLVRDQAQREQIAALTTRLKELEGATAAGGGKVARRGGPPLDEDWMDPSKEELQALARQCGVRIDVPPIMRGEPMQIGPEAATAAALSADELGAGNQVFVDLAASWRQRVRGWYIEATGDSQGGDLLSAHAMGEELQDKAAPGEPAAVQRRISQERAGLVPPPADPARLSPFERYFRAFAGLGDEAEQALAARIGADKAHVVRGHDGGWPMRMSMSGCNDGPGAPPADGEP